MKRIAILLTALALVATGCNKGQKFTLAGSLEAARFNVATDSLLLQSDGLPTIQSIQVNDGQFSYAGKVEKPAAATLKGVGRTMVTKYVVLEKGEISFQDGFPCGTPLNDAYGELLRSLQTVAKEHPGDAEAIYAAALPILRTYITNHPKDASAVVALMSARRFTKPEALAELIAMTSPEVQNDGNIHWIKKQLKSAK